MAGESAADIARRQRERAARLERSAAAWERGAQGERTTAALLDELTAECWTAHHDVAWPGRQRANLDHVVVGPGGVFVIDTKNWSSDVRIENGTLWRGRRRCEREVAAAAEGALAVTRLLGGYAPATAVLCFVRDERLGGWARDVMVCSTNTIQEMLRTRKSTLDDAQIASVRSLLEERLGSAKSRRPLSPSTRPQSARSARESLLLAHRSRPARRSRGSLKRTERITALRGFIVAVAMAIAAVTLLPKIAAHTPELLGLAPAQAEFGESVSLHGSSKRPSLEITAAGPVSLRAKVARRPLHRGQRLVAVRVDVRSVSSQEWTSPKLAVRATDSRGHTLRPRAIDQIARGARLPRSLHLGAGGHVAGYVAFAVGSKAKIEDFALTLGPSSYETVHWERAH